jgi:hypothetical protein
MAFSKDEHQSCSGEKSGADTRETEEGERSAGAKALVDLAQFTAQLCGLLKSRALTQSQSAAVAIREMPEPHRYSSFGTGVTESTHSSGFSSRKSHLTRLSKNPKML